METTSISITRSNGTKTTVPAIRVHTLVIGSGAAGLNAAVQLKSQGVDDLVIVTEGLDMGTSINTGSDKQTYYKLSICSDDADSPLDMAETYFAGGSMHGDLALVEAANSARAFTNLVGVGVPFPRDPFGQFIGYKTDHDPRRRATSIGPYTSRRMCEMLIREVQRLGIAVHENRNVVELITVGETGDNCVDKNDSGSCNPFDSTAKRAAGAVVVDSDGQLSVYLAENTVFAVGGPGGLYRTSVYPNVHTGAIGLALQAGAVAQSLPESQYGLASTKFRWNVSGTFMQVVPRFVSTESDGSGEPREFMRDYFDTVGQMCSNVFLKGYQWPFDSRKVIGGSSIVDILVYIETVLNGRRVYLDFRSNPDGFAFDELSDESREYLEKSGAMLDSPINRLRKMNPGAIDLYADHGIDITFDLLEVAVCAQHNNGGLAANHWWESVNVSHLFPVGEVNGSHGVYRPGGSALNSGQVGSLRAAEYIAARYRETSLDVRRAEEASQAAVADLLDWLDRCDSSESDWQVHRAELQQRMSKAGAHIRAVETLDAAISESHRQLKQLNAKGCKHSGPGGITESLRNRHLALAHVVYLEAVRYMLQSGVGSRGSAMVVHPDGVPVHPSLDESWRIVAENPVFRDQVQETVVTEDGHAVENRWVARRPIPEPDIWFETAWAKFRNGEIYD